MNGMTQNKLQQNTTNFPNMNQPIWRNDNNVEDLSKLL